jgi:integrator complex subunit 4
MVFGSEMSGWCALINPPFAELSLNFLADMFNDEIESVRLQDIFSLTKISRHIILREDQIEVMLGSLEEYSVEVRESLHVMLGACEVSTRACLTLVVQKVLNVLSKYPQDKLSAYGCMQKVGMKHVADTAIDPVLSVLWQRRERCWGSSL